MDENTTLKLLAVLVTFIAALVGGYLPIWYGRIQKGQALLTHGYFFAKGIFLGTALLHLLPVAITQFASQYPGTEYPVIGLVAILTIFILHVIERYSTNLLGRMAPYSNNVTIYLLILLLSIHSVIEGTALGIGSSFAEILVIFVAVLAHKSSAVFALVVKMLRHGFERKTIGPVVLIFACMTPLGILLGSMISKLLVAYNGHVILSVIDAIAAGTFIYIACLEQDDMPELVETAAKAPFKEIVSFGLGIGIMAIVAVWL